MLAKMIEKIAAMAQPTFHEVDGRTFSSSSMHEMIPKKYVPGCREFHSLKSICDMVRNEEPRVIGKIYIQANSYNDVDVFTSLDRDWDRDFMYHGTPDIPTVRLGEWVTQEDMIVKLQSLFIPSDDVTYLLSLLSNICVEDSVTSSDNGVTQTVNVTNGVALKKSVTVKPIVELTPFRTFLEVKQPESRFLLRVRASDGAIRLIEADGGAWKLEATRSIAGFFEKELADLVKAGVVVILR